MVKDKPTPVKEVEWKKGEWAVEFDEIYRSTVGVGSLKSFVRELLAKVREEAKREAVGEIKRAFIGEFCNDHDPVNPPRWLRGVAFDMPDLLRLILEFFDDLTEKGE